MMPICRLAPRYSRASTSIAKGFGSCPWRAIEALGCPAMIDLRDAVETIKGDLADGSARALTYAALECRLAIERICYDRLARAHDYISHEEVRRWQPHHVIKLLTEDVDPYVASTYTLSISRKPAGDDDDLATMDYVPVGTQVGFNGALIAKIWNALSNTALHVSLPKSSAASVSQYGDVIAIRAKVEQALAELERIARGTMTSTGFGPEAFFTCKCGARVKRRAEQLSVGKVIHCINPACAESYEVEFEGDDIKFVVRSVHTTCICDEEHRFPKAPLEKLRVGETARSLCTCGAETVFHWRLFSGVRVPETLEGDTD